MSLREQDACDVQTRVLVLLARNLRIYPLGRSTPSEEYADRQPGIDEHGKEFKDVDVQFPFGKGCIALGLGSDDWPTEGGNIRRGNA